MAQTAPEGNAHPATQDVMESGMTLPNPFGEPRMEKSARSTIEQKAEFARALDLAPLRSLAVFHNGRVKVLDTLSRESVRKITGRANYLDLVPGEGGKNTKVNFDPLFTLLDMTIDPAFYADRPLIGVDYLPLRRALVEASEPDVSRHEWLLRSGRVSPLVVDEFAQPVAQEHMSEEGFSRGLGRVDQAMRLFLGAKANYEMVAPTSREQQWRHIAMLAEASPVRTASAELGAAWRARDASKANAAIARLAAELPNINSETYPTTRRSLEIAYNRANAFEWGFWAYAFALVALLLAFGTGRRWLGGVGISMLAIAMLFHAFGFVTRCIIAERFAIQNQFESMTGLSLFAAVVGAAIMIMRRQWLFGAASAAVGFLVLITATQTAIPGQFIEREAAILNTSVLLKYHVTTVLCSYGLIALGFIVSLFHLGTHYAAKWRAAPATGAGVQVGMAGGGEVASAALGEIGSESPNTTTAKVLADLDTAQMVVLQLAFWTLGVGILLGAWWADHSWGRWWAFDPKETWALITWIIYLIVIHVRIAAPAKKGFTTAWLSVVGFIMMLWTYFGVNLLLPGLHAYA